MRDCHLPRKASGKRPPTAAAIAAANKRAAIVAAVAAYGGREAILDDIRGGAFVTDIAADLCRRSGQQVTPKVLGSWLNSSPEWRAELAAARKDAADALVEQAVVLVDGASEDRDSIAKAKAQADLRQWLASKYNRPMYGNDAAANVQVQVNMGDMHLDALRRREVPVVRIAEPPREGPDAEVVE